MRIEVRNDWCSVECNEAELQKLMSAFRTYAPGYRYTHLFKRKKWDGKVCLVQTGSIGPRFPTGLLPGVVDLFPCATIEDRRFIRKIDLVNTTVPLRDYQWNAVKLAFSNCRYGAWWPRGVFKVATGGGKTEIAAAMLEMTNVPSIFLVHLKQLVDQTQKRFDKYGVTNVTVTTIQSLMSFQHTVNKTENRTDEDVLRIMEKKAEKGEKVKAFLETIEQVFIDEAHLVASNLDKANLFAQALNLMPNAYMRWGLTATAFMREEYHDWLLEGSTGQILYEVKSKKLIEDGYLTPPNITMYRMKVKTLGDWQDDYDLGIVGNIVRNEKIIDCIKDREGPTMVLVQKIAHGELLVKMCKHHLLPVRFLHGGSSIEERIKALEELVAGALKAVIGSTIWDEGLDVAEIKTLILAGAGKSKIKNLQRLGRGLRLSEGKETIEVIDFFEEGSKWLRRHAVERRKLWLSEGFDVKVI